MPRNSRGERGPFLRFEQSHQVGQRPNAVAETRFHRWCNSQRLVNPAKVVVHKVESAGAPVCLDPLAECVSQPREAAHLHSHGEVIPFRMASRCEPHIRIARDRGFCLADKFARAVFAFCCAAENFDDLRKVDGLKSERGLDCDEVGMVAVCRELDAVRQSRREIANESVGALRGAISDIPARNQFCLGVDSNPRPTVALANAFHFGRAILILRSDETPNLVTLDTLACEVDHDAVRELLAGRADLVSEPRNGLTAEVHDAAGSALRVAIDKARNSACAVGSRKAIHLLPVDFVRCCYVGGVCNFTAGYLGGETAEVGVARVIDTAGKFALAHVAQIIAIEKFGHDLLDAPLAAQGRVIRYCFVTHSDFLRPLASFCCFFCRHIREISQLLARRKINLQLFSLYFCNVSKEATTD